MRKLVVSEWLTLDGVFDADLMDEWYAPYDSVSRQDCIRQGVLSAGSFLFGRTTYEMLAPYWSTMRNNPSAEMQEVADKLTGTPKYVVSSRLDRADWSNSTIIRRNVAGEVAKLKNQEGGEIQVEGSATLVRSLAEAGLVDEYSFLVHPIMMGKGMRFYPDGAESAGLRLVECRTLERDVVLLRYAVSAAG